MWVLWMSSRTEAGRWWGKDPRWSRPYLYQRLSSANAHVCGRTFLIVNCREDVMSWEVI